MPTKQSTLFAPPTRSQAVDKKGFLAEPLKLWLFTLQLLFPLITVDTTVGPLAETAPPAGLNSATGQSNQNMEITYVKSSADAHSYTLHGVEGGDIVISAQFAFFKIKSDGTNWWKTG